MNYTDFDLIFLPFMFQHVEWSSFKVKWTNIRKKDIKNDGYAYRNI